MQQACWNERPAEVSHWELENVVYIHYLYSSKTSFVVCDYDVGRYLLPAKAHASVSRRYHGDDVIWSATTGIKRLPLAVLHQSPWSTNTLHSCNITSITRSLPNKHWLSRSLPTNTNVKLILPYILQGAGIKIIPTQNIEISQKCVNILQQIFAPLFSRLFVLLAILFCCQNNKKAVLSQGIRAMPL